MSKMIWKARHHITSLLFLLSRNIPHSSGSNLHNNDKCFEPPKDIYSGFLTPDAGGTYYILRIPGLLSIVFVYNMQPIRQENVNSNIFDATITLH